nr:immunoglobulin heavy chain junction region [Mus musculus]
CARNYYGSDWYFDVW